MSSQGIEANLKTILALCENPHWTTDRKYRIAKLAQESLAEIKTAKSMPCNRAFAEMDDETASGCTDD